MILPRILLAAGLCVSASVAGASPAAIETEWSRYDASGRGALTALEFGRWIMAANGQHLDHAIEADRRMGESGSIATRLLNATATAFMLADGDRDGLISPDEMIRFTQG